MYIIVINLFKFNFLKKHYNLFFQKKSKNNYLILMEFPNFPINVLSIEDFLPVNIEVYKQYYLSSFERLMNSYGNDMKKTLIISPKFHNFMTYLITKEIKNSLNIDIILIKEGISNRLEFPIFMINPKKSYIDIIINYHNSKYKNLKDQNNKTEIIFVPNETYEILEYIRKKNFNLSNFNINNYNIDLIPIDKDLFIFDCHNDLRKIYIENNYSLITQLAKSLMKLESIFGKFKSKLYFGNLTQLLKKCFEREEEKNKEILEQTKEEIFSLIVFDRSVDFITPMCTNYTYEGLIDEYFGIEFNKISVKDNLINVDVKKKFELEDKNVTFKLYNNKFYETIRSMHYLHANKYLANELIQFSEVNEKAKKETDFSKLQNTIREFKKYLNKKDDIFKNYNLAKYITNNQNNYKNIKIIQTERILLNGFKVANIQNIYDELIGRKVNLYDILRLMVIENNTRNGIFKYNILKRDLLNIYGFQYIFLFDNLEKLDWLKDRDFFQRVKKFVSTDYLSYINKFQLINKNFNMEKITDCSFVLGELCPICLKLIEKFISGGWSNFIDLLKKKSFLDYPKNEKQIFENKKEKNFIFVVFIGGITYAEIEGIRFLNMINNDFKFIIITTSILNYKKCFEQLDFKKEINYFSFRDFTNQNVEDLETILKKK